MGEFMVMDHGKRCKLGLVQVKPCSCANDTH